MEIGVVQSEASRPESGISDPMPFAQGANYAADKKRQAVPVLFNSAGNWLEVVLDGLFSLTGCPLACEGLQITQAL